MGFISNQWLNKGYGYRSRSYSPVPVEISSRRSLRYNAAIELTASKSNGEYHTVHLSDSEAAATVATAFDVLSHKSRERLLLSLLGDLPDAGLLRMLALDLRRRVRSTKGR